MRGGGGGRGFRRNMLDWWKYVEVWILEGKDNYQIGLRGLDFTIFDVFEYMYVEVIEKFPNLLKLIFFWTKFGKIS